MGLLNRLTGAAYRRQSAFPWNVLSFSLIPFAVVYGLAMSVRAWAFRHGWLASFRSATHVISIGNLTLGGTGKTPVTAFLAKSLGEHGQPVAVVSRGYHGQAEGRCLVVSDGVKMHLDAKLAGDEPYLLAQTLPGTPVIISARRAMGVAKVQQEFPGRIVLCDDAFSHLALQRDLDLLLVHGRDGLGNGRCLPAGPLREPPRAIRRAAAVLLNVTAGEDPEVERELRRFGFAGPLFRFSYGAPCLVRLADRTRIEPDSENRLLVFAAIARPDDFFRGLASAGWSLAATREFPDHHAYTDSDLAELAALAISQNVSRLATTAKDAVKLPAKLPPTLEVLVADFSLEWPEGDLPRLLELVAARIS